MWSSQGHHISVEPLVLTSFRAGIGASERQGVSERNQVGVNLRGR